MGRRADLQLEREGLLLGRAISRNEARTDRRAPTGAPILPRSLGDRVARLARALKRYPGNSEEGVMAGQLALPGTPYLVQFGEGLKVRSVLAGTRIIVAPSAVMAAGAPGAAPVPGRRRRSGPSASKPMHGRPIGGRVDLADRATLRRLEAALAVVDAAWPSAGRAIRIRTRLIVPLEEPGLVSYSLAARPGVTFLNLRGKRLVDLADDLLHETGHHALHTIERRTPIVRGSTAGASGHLGQPGQLPGEPRYWSPWRRSLRPVRGLVHACYTFAFRAELFHRIVARADAFSGRCGPLRVTAALERELLSESRKEASAIASVLPRLLRPEAARCLTPAGVRLVRAMNRGRGYNRRSTLR